MKLHEIFIEGAAYDGIGYDGKTVTGSVKEFFKRYNISPTDIKNAIDRFTKTDVCRKLEIKIGPFSSSSTELKNGTLVFGNAKSKHSTPLYNINGYGQIRSISGSTPSRLPSPDPMRSNDSNPEEFLFKIYVASAEALLAKKLKTLNVIDMSGMNLDKLKDMSTEEIKKFYCDGNNLTNLAGCPKAEIISVANNKLTSLKGLPSTVKGLEVYDNKLSSFDGLDGVDVDYINFNNNEFKTLKDIHKHIKSADRLYFENNPIESNILGLMKIKNLRAVLLPGPKEITKIINSHLPGGDIIECQQELIETGFAAYAKL